MPHRVFISHAGQDGAVAARICAALETAGIRCWIAPRDLPPGKCFAGAVAKAIEEAELFLILISEHANRSQHVIREEERAVACSVPILPIRLQAVGPSGTLEFFGATAPSFDASDLGDERGVSRLVEHVRQHLAQPLPGATGPEVGGALDEMDDDLEESLEEVETGLGAIPDPNARAALARRMRRLEADYRRARRELPPDLYHLYTLVGELRRLLIEVSDAREFLEPPFETFERLVGITRGQAQALDDTGVHRRQDVMARIAALERAGKEAWEREDAGEWKSVVRELEKLNENLEQASRPPFDPRDYPPEAFLRALLGWTDELRDRVAENELEPQFGPEIDRVEASARAVDLRHADQARGALLAIIQDEFKPLSHRVERAIREGGGEAKTGVPFVDWGGVGSVAVPTGREAEVPA